jgi:hypothetical protein
VSDADRIEITRAFFAAAQAGRTSDAQRYLHPDVTFKQPRSGTVRGPSRVASAMASGLRKHRARLGAPRAGSGATTRVSANAGGRSGTMTLRFDGDKIVRIQ